MRVNDIILEHSISTANGHIVGQVDEGAIWDKVKASTNKLTNTVWDTMVKLKSDYSPEQIKQKWEELKAAIAQEKEETKEMWTIYQKWMQCESYFAPGADEGELECPTPEEITVANEQMKDLLKASGLAILFALPIPGGALLVASVIKIGAKFGVQLVPSAFQKPVPEPDDNVAGNIEPIEPIGGNTAAGSEVQNLRRPVGVVGNNATAPN